jgi:conjugative relaxase-like TrwC/TraI family protein
MMTPRALESADQAATYFELDDYYVDGEQLSASAWFGKGAERLGLSGEVDRAAFASLLHGRLPNGVVIAKGGAGSHRPGVDLTFSAPKSVSLSALVGGNARILAAHGRAVAVALSYLEQTASRSRSKRDGIVRLEQNDNLLIARFNHDSSRATDPQLHTHAVVLNVAQRQDGAWKALSNEEIFRSTKAAGAIYRAELARDLRELGYEIERTHADGRFEIAGFGKNVLDAFSRRRAQIVEHMERVGVTGPKAGDIAARATRDPKRDNRRSIMLADWRNRAESIGIDFDRVRSPRERSPLGSGQTAAKEVLAHALEHLSERKVIASEKQILQVALGIGVGRVRFGDLERALGNRLRCGELVPAISSRQKDPFARHYTTDRALAVEQDLIHLMKRSRDSVPSIVSEAEVDRSIAGVLERSPFPLTEGQENAIRLALSTQDRLIGIQGYAGTGKTSGALLHIRRIAEAEGYEVRGFAPSAAAAEVLEREAGISSMTLARLLHGSRPASKKPQLWIVDEVSMMGNETARALLHAAKEAKARVIWVGDRDQLPSIEAGRAFALLMEQGLSVAKIETIVRQRDPNLRKAVEHTIHREHDKAIGLLEPKIIEIADKEERIRGIAREFLELSEGERRATIVITPSNTDRRRLNQLIRVGLRERGALSGRQVETAILVGRDLTKAETKDPANYRAGDVLRFGRSTDPRFAGGEYFTIARAAASASGIILRGSDGRELEWKPARGDRVEVYELEKRSLAAGDLIRWTRNDNEHGRYNAELAQVLSIQPGTNTAQILVHGRVQIMDLGHDLHWEHAYASTVHAAQGRTADRLLLHVDASQGHLLGHESWYVGISRARNEIRIFTDDASRLPAGIARSLEQESALEVASVYRRRERDRGHQISH